MLPSDDPKVANFKDGFACWELALTFYEEANRAVQAGVWFAAAAAVAAALEAMLLAKMFTNTDEVAQLASFRKLLDKHQGDFGSFARKEMDLGKLLEMAKELAWFRPGGVPSLLTNMLAQYVDPDTLTALAVIFKDSPSAGYTSADLLRQCRNLLHPAYCLKLDIHLAKDTGIRATFFCLVAYASLGSI
jgi:HEPN domain-containing protein